MKKYVLILMSLSFCLCFFACGSDAQGDVVAYIDLDSVIIED